MDKVYVIYFDGKMYTNKSRKIAYLKIGNARRVITSESKILAEGIAIKDNKYWWSLSDKEKQEYIDKIKQRFEIREFVENK